jgi:dolichol-phosphate mannosyltransferase
MEAENILGLVEGVERALDGVRFELIVVDDNSSDGTADLAEKLNVRYGNIRVLRRPNKMGLASAILDGVEKGRGDVVAVMDADLQHPPSLLPLMFKKILSGCDVVVASRYIDGGGVEGWSIWRRLISLGAIKLAHLLFPRMRGVRDLTSGYFMFRREIIRGVELNPTGFKVLLEILARLAGKKYVSVAEVPYTFRPRRRGKSKLNLNEIGNYVRHLLRLFIKCYPIA